MRAERGVLLQQAEEADDVVCRVLEKFCRRAVERNVKMDAPFVAVGSLAAFDSNIEIAVALNRSIALALNHLVEIDVVGESPSGLPCLGGGLDLDGGASVNLADPD